VPAPKPRTRRLVERRPAVSHENNPILRALEDIRARDAFRSVAALEGLPAKFVKREGRRCLNLSSNDYLGLAGHPVVKQAAAAAALSHGAGAGGSRLLGGGLPLHRELEEEIARLRPVDGGAARALLFNTGFMANLGILQSLGPLLGPIYSDKLNHASVAEALRSCGTSFHRYRHLDMTHLASLLERHGGEGPGLVCSETLFSMDGDLARIDELLALQARFGFWLYLDEAHSTGCLPRLAEEAVRGAAPGKLILMGTFGKAYGGFGAYAAAPASVIDYLVNAARPFIFSTALPPAAAGGALAALRIAEAESWRRDKLAETAGRAREEFRRRGFDTGSSASHILPVIAGSNGRALALSAAMFHAGYHTPPVRHPTVPQGTSRLRINLTCELEWADVAGLAEALERALASLPEDPSPPSAGSARQSSGDESGG
jgi:8-amino-7-oxononanoate synthase